MEFFALTVIYSFIPPCCNVPLVTDIIILKLMDVIQSWAVAEMKTHMCVGLLEDSELKQMIAGLVNLDSASINQELSGLLDFSLKEV